MKPTSLPLCLALVAITPLSSCKKKEEAVPPPVPSPTRVAEQKQDIPLLPIKSGDFWRYQNHLEIPPDITKPGDPAVDRTIERTRTYIGKASAGEGLAETDCFEVTATGSPTEREFVDINDDKILLRGSLIVRPEPTKPLWYERGIPFVSAGVKAGDELQEFQLGSQSRTRKIQVIGREDVTVPAGTFACIRLLMGGMDGTFELRRTIWFSPGNGIVREEKTRYHADKLILRETQELVETSVKKR